MTNSKGPSTVKSMYNGKHSLLPPKSPFPSIAPSYADYVPTPSIGPKGIPKYREGNSHHQRTSSESHLIEEQPSWLDELLNEPETPVRRGHRRSSSDSFAYSDAANDANMYYSAQDEYRFRNLTSVPWGSQEFDTFKDTRNASFYAEPNSMLKHRNRPWESSSNALAHSGGLATARDNFIPQNTVPPCASREVDGISSTATEKQDAVDSGLYDGKAAFERKDSSCAKASSDTDTKRSKQQFAQRSRVRKLQYIAELERNVQALQVEGTGVSAELDFLNQQSLILSMENQALKQRLDNLAQEQLIKCLEHEVLEREIGRLRVVYQQQQPPPQQQQQQQAATSHRRTKSRDYLDLQFANLSLKNKDSPAPPGPLHI